MIHTPSFHRVIAGIHASSEGSLERIQAFCVCEFGAVFLSFLLGRNLRRSFFFGGGRGLALLHAAPHGACDGPRTGARAGVASDGTYGRTTGSAAGCPLHASSFGCVGIVSSCLLFGLFLLGAFRCWRRGFGVDSGLLFSGSVTFTLVLELLVWSLAIPSKDKNSDVF